MGNWRVGVGEVVGWRRKLGMMAAGMVRVARWGLP